MRITLNTFFVATVLASTFGCGAVKAQSAGNLLSTIGAGFVAALQKQNGTQSPPVASAEQLQQERQNQAIAEFMQVFGCKSDTPVAPIRSQFELQSLHLGGICAQTPTLTVEQMNQLTQQVRPIVNGKGPASISSSILVAIGNLRSKIVVLDPAARPPGLPQSVFVTFDETVDAADPTNSLERGNAFRTALEAKYGQPAGTISRDEILNAAHKNNVATVKMLSAAGNDNSSADIAQAVNMLDEKVRRSLQCNPNATTFGLIWHGNDGTLMTVEPRAVDDCGRNPEFEITLQPDPDAPAASRFLFPWSSATVSYNQQRAAARSSNAPIPAF
jgi:hypothetical protein